MCAVLLVVVVCLRSARWFGMSVGFNFVSNSSTQHHRRAGSPIVDRRVMPSSQLRIDRGDKRQEQRQRQRKTNRRQETSDNRHNNKKKRGQKQKPRTRQRLYGVFPPLSKWHLKQPIHGAATECEQGGGSARGCGYGHDQDLGPVALAFAWYWHQQGGSASGFTHPQRYLQGSVPEPG